MNTIGTASVRVRRPLPRVDARRAHLRALLRRHQLEDAHAGQTRVQNGRGNLFQVSEAIFFFNQAGKVEKRPQRGGKEAGNGSFHLVEIATSPFSSPNRLVHLDKLRLRTRAREAEQALARGGRDPFIVVKNPSASKGGVAETSIKVGATLSLTILLAAVFLPDLHGVLRGILQRHLQGIPIRCLPKAGGGGKGQRFGR